MVKQIRLKIPGNTLPDVSKASMQRPPTAALAIHRRPARKVRDYCEASKTSSTFASEATNARAIPQGLQNSLEHPSMHPVCLCDDVSGCDIECFLLFNDWAILWKRYDN